ncbi:helix-turn-helix domain-containing protein [Actinocorallia aurantiaca]|uniref:Helix-turn-helix transcriptional regulator n=1 Tax=Actinocorallia aurantiaca TaxID=46204 RepID=A0ABP6GSD6_9ACTN
MPPAPHPAPSASADARTSPPLGAAGAARTGPTALRMMVGAQLRRLRERSGISREEAADAIRATHSKISRLELGRSGFKQRDLLDLLDLYGVGGAAERATLLELARQAGEPGWWQRYQDVMPGWLEPYIGLEQAAAVIRSYEVQFVHGLMQTEDYARAVISIGAEHMPENETERRVVLRLSRQRLLAAPDRPRLWAVLDEAVLRRPLGGRQVMRGQLRHLLELTEDPAVTLQVVPFRVGAHPAAGGPFTILRFPQPDLPDVVYLEQLNSALYLDKPEEVRGYLGAMDRLCVVAESAERTRETLRELLREM